jgi:Uma2 family endonuclease
MATAQAKIINEPRIYLWTREDYYRMNDVGLFNGKKVELIEGQVIEMSAMYGPHATAITLANDTLREVFGKGWVVRIQLPIAISGISEPEPDVAIVAGKVRDFKESHPTSAALVIEVADSSLEYDRDFKGSLYAKAGIADYWIINLFHGQIEVYRRPIADQEAEFGVSYGDKLVFKRDDLLKPLAKPKATIAVNDLLP